MALMIVTVYLAKFSKRMKIHILDSTFLKNSSLSENFSLRNDEVLIHVIKIEMRKGVGMSQVLSLATSLPPKKK